MKIHAVIICSMKFILAINSTSLIYHLKKFALLQVLGFLMKAETFLLYSLIVMLHARTRGETFGLACGEFAISQKPIVSYRFSAERAHLDILGPVCTTYATAQELVAVMESGAWKKEMTNNGYMQYTPERVMAVFRSVFLQ